MRRITIAGVALAALLVLGAAGAVPGLALASSGSGGGDTPHQYVGYGYPAPYGWDGMTAWSGFYNPYTTTYGNLMTGWGFPYNYTGLSGYPGWGSWDAY